MTLTACTSDIAVSESSLDVELKRGDSYLSPPSYIMMDQSDFYRYFTDDNILCATTHTSWLSFLKDVMDDNHHLVEESLTNGDLLYIPTNTECNLISSENLNNMSLQYYDYIEITEGDYINERLYTILHATFDIDSKPLEKDDTGIFVLNAENELVFNYHNLENTTELIVPSSIDGIDITHIPFEAFASAYDVTKITIPEGVVSIDTRAFQYCSSLTEIILPTTLKSVGDYAFSSCSSLEYINIPENVSSIGNSCFSDSGLKEIILPDSLTTIPSYTFSYCSNLISVDIGSNIITIGESAFRYCENLTDITYPSSLTLIETNAFRNCPNFTTTFPNSIILKDDSDEIITPNKQENDIDVESLKTNSSVTSSDELFAYAITASQGIVKEYLKYPDTAKFPTSSYTVKRNENTWIVSGYVDSNNALNQVIREYYDATFTMGDISGTNYKITNYSVVFK